MPLADPEVFRGGVTSVGGSRLLAKVGNLICFSVCLFNFFVGGWPRSIAKLDDWPCLNHIRSKALCSQG